MWRTANLIVLQRVLVVSSKIIPQFNASQKLDPPPVVLLVYFPTGSSGFLLFTDGIFHGNIKKADIQNSQLTSTPKAIVHSYYLTPEAVTYDPAGRYVYWSDTHSRTISRAFLNGSSEEVVVRNVRKAVAMAVDFPGQNLYWADTNRGRVEVSRLDGKYRKTLVQQRRPLGFLLDVERR